MKTLRIADDRRRFVTDDGGRIYLIGDTAWELFHKATIEDARFYLETRKNQGFNLIQAVVLSEFYGLNTPNAYGRFPLQKNSDGEYDPTMPDLGGEYHYFDHVEAILRIAEELGLYVGLLPTWGDKFNKKTGKGPEIFNPDNAYVYGRWIAETFAHHDNLIWILGGDRALENEQHYAIIDQMAKGLRDGDGGKFLITYHPDQLLSSSDYLNDRDWLDFNMMQSGHTFPCTPRSYEMLARDFAKLPVRPTMDGEQCYEDHPKNFDPQQGYFDACDVRTTMYRNLFAGSAGNTYGHHSVWGLCTEASAYWPNTWKTALFRPAACQMPIFAKFIEDHDLTKHTPIENAVIGNAHDENYTAAMVSAESVYLYIPCGIPVRLDLNALPFIPSAVRTFEPTSGIYSESTAVLDPSGYLTFKDRGAGRGMDVVVILLP